MESLPTSPRRSRDLLQLAAAGCVALLIVGEVALLVVVFRQHRSRHMPVQASEEVVVAPSVLTTNAPVTNVVVAPTPKSSSVVEVAAPVLNPALKIQEVRWVKTPGAAQVEVRLRAQTGERQFEGRAAQVGIEWELVDGTRQEEWLAVPVEWENFAVKTLRARYDGAVARVRGCTVRTWYRQQLQDTKSTEISIP